MEKLKFALLVFTVLLAFPVITILELNRTRQSIQLNESAGIELGKRAQSYAVNVVGTNTRSKKSVNYPGGVNNSGNKKGHIKYAL